MLGVYPSAFSSDAHLRLYGSFLPVVDGTARVPADENRTMDHSGWTDRRQGSIQARRVRGSAKHDDNLSIQSPAQQRVGRGPTLGRRTRRPVSPPSIHPIRIETPASAAMSWADEEASWGIAMPQLQVLGSRSELTSLHVP